MHRDLSLEQIRDLLSTKSLDLSPGVDVERIEVNPYVDSHGEDSLEVLIVLADDTEIPLPSDWSLKTQRQILQQLLSNRCDLWPYTRYALESELHEAVEE